MLTYKVQDLVIHHGSFLAGNIRVYCRVRPFLSGQSAKQTTMQYIGENGELVVINPSKPGKSSHRLFKFNKVFGPASTQGSELNFNIQMSVYVLLICSTPQTKTQTRMYIYIAVS